MNDVGRVQVSGKKIAKERKRQALSQNALAIKLEMTVSNIQRIERQEETGIYLDTLRKLSEWIGKSPDETKELFKPEKESKPIDLKLLDELQDLAKESKLDASFLLRVMMARWRQSLDEMKGGKGAGLVSPSQRALFSDLEKKRIDDFERAIKRELHNEELERNRAAAEQNRKPRNN